MIILGLTPSNPMTGDTPEQLYLKSLEKLGHTVLLREGSEVTYEDVSSVDVVVSLSEVTCEVGAKISQKFNKPFYAHMEWLPRWRVFLDVPENWGYEKNDITYAERIRFVTMYQRYAYFWNMADCKSVAANCFVNDMQDFIGQPTDIEVKYLGPNTELLKEEVKKQHIENNEVTCIARFVPHKRLHHVIQALIQIGFDGKLNLVGYGDESKKYAEYMKDAKFEGMIYPSSEKFECIRRSKVVVALWSGIVPAEALYLGVPCVTYTSDYMDELYGNSIIYANNNSIKSLGNMIKMFLDESPEVRNEVVARSIQEIESGKTNVLSLEATTKELERLILKAVEAHK